MSYTKEQFENTAFEAVNEGDGKRIIAFYEELGFKQKHLSGSAFTAGVASKTSAYYYTDYHGVFFNWEHDLGCALFTIKPFSIIEQWEREQAQKELEKVNNAMVTKSIFQAIKDFEENEPKSILDYTDKSITVSIKMHGVTNSVSIQDDDCTIYKMATLFNSVLLGAGFSKKVINKVFKMVEK